MRAAFVRLHRWAGLATALFLLLAGGTGSILAFKDELDARINPHLFAAAPPPARDALDFEDALALRERVARLYPMARADHLSFPQAGQAQMFYLMPRLDPRTGQPYPLAVDQVFVDPYTGAPLGARKWGELFSDGAFQRENIIPFVWRLHEAIALPHPWGKLFMGVVALVWTLDCFVGLQLTFPRKSPFLPKWKTAWLVKRGASWKRINLDLHRAGALWLWLVLLVFAWSSVMLNLRDIVYKPVMSPLFQFSDEQPPRLARPRTSPELGWREAHALAKAALGQLAVARDFVVLEEESLWYRPALGAYLYRTRTSLDIRHRNGFSDLWIDGDTGRVVHARFDGRGKSGDAVSAWLRVLHTGEVWGLGYRIFVAVLGMAVAMLSVTGVVVWWVKRGARRRTKPATL